MKTFITALALTALIASPAFAAKKKKVVKKAAEITAPVTESAPTPVYSHNPSSHPAPFWSATFGIGTVGGKFGFGPTLKAQWPVELEGNAFKFGGRTGFIFGPSSPTSFLIPILATAEYEFVTSNSLKPFLGLEMGLTFSHSSASGLDTSVGGITIHTDGSSASSTDFAFLAVPGFNVGDDHLYFVELPFGVISTSFTILPSFGMRF